MEAEEKKEDEIVEEIEETSDDESEESLIDKTNKAAERLENANKKAEDLVKRQERIIAEQRLHGKGVAGQPKKKETEDEKWAREAKERYAGTGIDPT
jgi:hypothetical protein